MAQWTTLFVAAAASSGSSMPKTRLATRRPIWAGGPASSKLVVPAESSQSRKDSSPPSRR